MPRRNYFIKKRFQMSFVYKFVLLLLLESILITGLFMYVSGDTLTTGYAHSILKIERTSNFFFIPFLFITLIVAVGIAMAGMLVFILISHRIAGPLYRFEKVLQQMEQGDLTANIALRKTDQLKELNKTLNTLIHSLDKRMGRIKTSLVHMQELLSKADEPENISKLNAAVASVKDEISHFKVTADIK